MAFRDDLLAVLAGGLPAIIDGQPAGGGVAPTVVQTPPRVEEQPPEPQLRDREPFLLNTDLPRNVLLGTAVIVGLLAVILIARR